MTHLITMEPKQTVSYSFSLPVPNSDNFVWIGFTKEDRVSPSFSILDRSTGKRIYYQPHQAEMMAKLHFSKPEKLEFSFENSDSAEVDYFSGILYNFRLADCWSRSNASIVFQVPPALKVQKVILQTFLSVWVD